MATTGVRQTDDAARTARDSHTDEPATERLRELPLADEADVVAGETSGGVP